MPATTVSNRSHLLNSSATSQSPVVRVPIPGSDDEHAPKVVVDERDGIVQRIRVICTCGHETEIHCKYE